MNGDEPITNAQPQSSPQPLTEAQVISPARTVEPVSVPPLPIATSELPQISTAPAGAVIAPATIPANDAPAVVLASNTPSVPQSDNPYTYQSEYAYEDDDSEAAIAEPITWTASEFVHHEKTPVWYVSLGVTALVVCIVAWLLTKDYIAVGTLAFVVIMFGIMANRRPQSITYRLDDSGVIIGDKPYAYADFKSFGIFDEGQFASISLLPLKRFMPAINLYFEPEQEDHIIDILLQRLPFDNREPDLTDHLMRKIRF